MKFITTIITGAIVGALGVYFTLDWQEENLIYSITAPAKFGEINYQNIHITNTGWNPAINLKVYIDHPEINFSTVQSKTSLKDLSKEQNGIAGIERIRRDESVTISLAYKGQPLFGTEVKIASDRSIALQVEVDDKDEWPFWAVVVTSIFGFWFTIGILASVSIPAYKDYVKRAKEAEAARKQQENL